MLNINIMLNTIVSPLIEAKVIKDAIETALDSSYSSIEIIVVDDGSTDRTLTVVKSFVQKGVKAFHKKMEVTSKFLCLRIYSSSLYSQRSL